MNDLVAQTRLIVRNDLRLLWRDLQASRWKDFLSIALAVVLFLIANSIAIPVMFYFGQHLTLRAEMIAWFFFGFIMLGAAMNHAIRVLFERADFDLLLASPVSPRAILLARLLTMTTGAALSVAIFLLPLLDGAIVALSWRYLSGYAVWLLLSCAVASAGVWGTLLLVAWLGPRRARIWAQVIAAFLGAGIYLTSHLGQIMRGDALTTFFDLTGRILSHPAFIFVGQAGRGDLASLGVLLGITILFSALTTHLLSRMFITGVQEAGGIVPGKRTNSSRSYVFVDGTLRATFRKDLRLILRDPLLIAQVLPFVMYTVPAFFVFIRAAGPEAILAGFAVVIASQLSGILTTIAASGEEGWDLIRLSPTPELKLRTGKMAAGMVVPLLIALILCLILGAMGRPGLALTALIFSALTSVGCAWIQVTRIKPSPRKDILTRSGRSWDIGRGIISTLITVLGAVGVGLAGSGYLIAAVGVLGVCTAFVASCLFSMKIEEVAPREFSRVQSEPAT